MATAMVRRGPWGHILDDKAVSDRCLFRLGSLADGGARCPGWFWSCCSVPSLRFPR